MRQQWQVAIVQPRWWPLFPLSGVCSALEVPVSFLRITWIITLRCITSIHYEVNIAILVGTARCTHFVVTAYSCYYWQ